MTKIFVPVFAAALLTIGTLNAQTPKGKPAPAVKKETAPVNKVPIPVARPVVPVTKPAPSVVKPAVPVVAKPAPAPAPKPVAAPAPKPVAVKPAAPAPAPKPVAAKPAAKKAPAVITKAPVQKKAVAKKATKKQKAAPVVEEIAPARRTAPQRYNDDMPAPHKVQERKIVVREMESDNDHEEKTTGSCCDKHNDSWKSIDNCDCYKHAPHDCKPWRFRYRRYYRYNYTMEHYNACKKGCNSHHSCGHH